MMNKVPEKNLGPLLVWVAGIYVFCVAAAVVHSWLSGVHLFDLSLTVSLYVALHQWTAVLYFIGAAVICFLLFLYVRKTEMRATQKLLYYSILLCVFGCARFPCNSSRSALTTDIHNYFFLCLSGLSGAVLCIDSCFCPELQAKNLWHIQYDFFRVFYCGICFRVPSLQKHRIHLGECTHCSSLPGAISGAA